MHARPVHTVVVLPGQRPASAPVPQAMPPGQGAEQFWVPPQPSPIVPQYWPPPAGRQVIFLAIGIAADIGDAPTPAGVGSGAGSTVEPPATTVADDAAVSRRSRVAGRRNASRRNAQPRAAAHLTGVASAAIHRPSAAVPDLPAILAGRGLARHRRAVGSGHADVGLADLGAGAGATIHGATAAAADGSAVLSVRWRATDGGRTSSGFDRRVRVGEDRHLHVLAPTGDVHGSRIVQIRGTDGGRRADLRAGRHTSQRHQARGPKRRRAVGDSSR